MGHRKPREFYSDGDASNEDDVFRVKGQKACRVCHDFTSWVKNKKSNNDLVRTFTLNRNLILFLKITVELD